MQTILRYGLTILIGAAIGVAAAVHTVRAGALGSSISIGPWQTGRDFGTADASAKTRAVVAVRGLLALPAREARYYTAATDDAGRPLDGRCTYAVAGGALPARWWSLTLYDRDGYLVGGGPYSVESASLAPLGGVEGQTGSNIAPRRWRVTVAPEPGSGGLPTANLASFELTLRLYLPSDRGKGDPPRAVLPKIAREQC